MTSKIADESYSPSSSYGEPLEYDPEFRGPVRSRSCTDVFCLIIFLLFICGWVVIAIFALLYGDPSRLLFPTDSRGQVCGRDEAVKDRPYLFFFDLTRCASPKVVATGCPTPQVCVKECPKENWFFDAQTSRKVDMICKDGVNITAFSTSELISKDMCALYYVKSKSFGHRCVPRSFASFTQQIMDAVYNFHSSGNSTDKVEILTKAFKYIGRFSKLQQVSEGVFEDIKSVWWLILLGCLVAMAVSFLWIILLRFISSIMIWFSLIAFTGLCGYGSYYTLMKYLHLRNKNMNNTMSEAEFEFTLEFSKYAELEKTWLAFFIIILTVFVICFFVLIFLRKRVNIAIALIGQASKAVADMMSTLAFPVVPYFLQLLVVALFVLIAVFLGSAGQPEYRVVCMGTCVGCPDIVENATCSINSFNNENCPSASCQFFMYHKKDIIPYFHIYNIFALFWSMFFISAFCEMVLAGAFSSWYWAFDKEKHLTETPVLDSFGRTAKYHVGTVALGSLIIAIVRMIRVIFEYIDYKMKKKTDSSVVRCMSWCFRCCLWCLEKFLKFINRNAYIYCAIYGKSFCVSARNSFSLLMRNIARVIVLDKVTDFLLFIGKLVITAIMGLSAFFVFSGQIVLADDYIPPTNYYLTPVFIIVVATFFIASSFFSVYTMAVDTLFLCFLEDCERNDGSPGKPYFMSKDLMHILHKKNKTVVDEEVNKEEE